LFSIHQNESLMYWMLNLSLDTASECVLCIVSRCSGNLYNHQPVQAQAHIRQTRIVFEISKALRECGDVAQIHGTWVQYTLQSVLQALSSRLFYFQVKHMACSRLCTSYCISGFGQNGRIYNISLLNLRAISE
jgi:hypothetical protein